MVFETTLWLIWLKRLCHRKLKKFFSSSRQQQYNQLQNKVHAATRFDFKIFADSVTEGLYQSSKPFWNWINKIRICHNPIPAINHKDQVVTSASAICQGTDKRHFWKASKSVFLYIYNQHCKKFAWVEEYLNLIQWSVCGRLSTEETRSGLLVKAKSNILEALVGVDRDCSKDKSLIIEYSTTQKNFLSELNVSHLR